MVLAGNYFDPNRNIEFSTYATNSIRNNARREFACNHQHYRRYQTVFYAPCFEEDGSETFGGTIANPKARKPEDIAEMHDLERTVHNFIAGLDGKHQDILSSRLGQGGFELTQRQAASFLGISAARVGQIEKDVKQELRNILQKTRRPENKEYLHIG